MIGRLSGTVGVILIAAAGNLPAQQSGAGVPRPRPQNPSPMVETTRAHDRLPPAFPAGIQFTADAGLPKPVDVFLPASAPPAGELRALVHVHGASSVVAHAAARASLPTLAVAVHLGAGSSAYDRPFADPGAFERLLGGVRAGFEAQFSTPLRLSRVYLSGFSAGYGAVRAMARTDRPPANLGGILLLDGLHAAYEPEGRVLAEGGGLDAADLDPFVTLARRAARGDLALLITHSEIFPGTFASTTETTDHLLAALGQRRTAVLKWGPSGMQQVSETRAGRLAVFGFAGNSAPDHIDHFHGLPAFFEALIGLAR